MSIKKIMILILACTFFLPASGCGKAISATPVTTEDTEEIVEDLDYDYSWQQYIVPGAYTYLQVPGNKSEIPDELVDARIEENLESYSEENAVTDRGAQNGDNVYFDDQSYIDGEDSLEENEENQMVQLGSEELYEDFSNALIGVKSGDTISFEITYPADYESESIAGQTVHYIVTVNDVTKTTIPNLTDDQVQVMSEHSATVDEYREEVRDDLMLEYEDAMNTIRETNLWNEALEDTVLLEYPEGEVEAEQQSELDEYKTVAEENDMTYEELLESYKEEGADLEETTLSNAQRVVKQRLLQQAIMDLEGLEVTDDIYQEYGEVYCTDQGYDTLEAWEADVGRDSVLQTVTYQYVTQYLMNSSEEIDEDNDPVEILGYSSDDIIE